MANDIYRNRLINDIRYSVNEAKNAAILNHPGLVGTVRELATSKIFKPLLPGGFKTGSGKITDMNGKQSSQTDVVIHNESILPPILYSERDGVFPIEACFYAIEVKSKLTAVEVKDSIVKGRSIIDLDFSQIGPIQGNASPVVNILFSFDSDLEPWGMTELERYAKYDASWENDPVVKAICVVGRGYWTFYKPNSSWYFAQPTTEFDEVVYFVSGMTNTLCEAVTQHRKAHLGRYLAVETNWLKI